MKRNRKLFIEKTAYGGWPNCYRIANGIVDLILTTDIGPRILRFGFIGKENEFFEMVAHRGMTGGKEWRIYGGHRLWYAPEEFPRTYYPDNGPVKCEPCNGFVRLVQPAETTTGIQKEMDIHISTDAAHVMVIHRLRNTRRRTLQMAPWALSVMAPGGVAIIPIRPKAPPGGGLLPTDSLALWPYTDMSDSRWTWGEKYVLLRQEPGHPSPQKLGVRGSQGWMAYVRRGHLFLVKAQHLRNRLYPDFGCSLEAYTNGEFLEVETLGPLAKLPAGRMVEHVEHWHLHANVPEPRSDADVEQYILPKASN